MGNRHLLQRLHALNHLLQLLKICFVLARVVNSQELDLAEFNEACQGKEVAEVIVRR